MKERKFEILGVLCIAISSLVIISMMGYSSFEDPGISPNVKVDNPMGILGVFIAYFFIKFSFGYSSYILPFLGIVWGWWFFSNKDRSSLSRVSAYLLYGMVLISISLGILEISISNEGQIDFSYSGLIGGNLANFLSSFFGIIGSIIIVITSWLIIIRGYFSWSLYSPFNFLINLIKKKNEDRKIISTEKKTEKEKRLHTKDLIKKIEEKQKEEQYHESSQVIQDGTDDEIEVDNEGINSEENKSVENVDREDTYKEEDIENINEGLNDAIDPQQASESNNELETQENIEQSFDENEQKDIEVGEVVKEQEVNIDELEERKAPKRKYQLPSSDLLEMPIKIQEGMSKDELVDRANFLTQSLETFGVVGKVVNVSPGPVITLFEVEPAEGVRVNKFVQLSDDLARVMEASRVRVIAPIPGKSSVGIEIPNICLLYTSPSPRDRG